MTSENLHYRNPRPELPNRSMSSFGFERRLAGFLYRFATEAAFSLRGCSTTPSNISRWQVRLTPITNLAISRLNS